MKKALLISIAVMGVLCGEWIRVTGSDNTPVSPKSEVLRSDSMGLFIHSSFTGFNEEDTTIDNKNFLRVEIPNTGVNDEIQQVGRPQLPYVRLLIAVPDSCSFSINVHTSDNTFYEDYLIYPNPRVVPVESAGLHYMKEVYAYDTAFYQKDTTIPNVFYEVKNDGYWRDQRVLEVNLYPIQYNPQQKLMYYYHGLDLRITYVGTAYSNTNGLGPFEDIGREMLLNYPGVDYQPGQRPEPAVHYYTNLTDPANIADYIIVTHNDFLVNETTSQWIHDFAQWRVDHNYFDVGIVKVQDIYLQFPDSAPDEAAQLRQFLRYAYRHWQSNAIPDGHFAYCLFIGDWDYVPAELIQTHKLS